MRLPNFRYGVRLPPRRGRDLSEGTRNCSVVGGRLSSKSSDSRVAKWAVSCFGGYSTT